MGCGTSCGSGVSGTGGGGGVPGITQIDTGNTVWVDEVFGNDGTGTVQRQDLPFLTIQAAVTAAAGVAPVATVVVRPGTYTEEVALPDNVHVVGVDRESTILTNVAGTTLRMGSSCSVSNMTIIPAGGPTTVGVSFTGTTLTTATLVNCTITATRAARAVELSGTGNAGQLNRNLEDCRVENRLDQAIYQDNGFSRLTNVIASGRFGMLLDRGTSTFEDCRFDNGPGGTSFTINALGNALLDNATRWTTLALAGTMRYDGTGISPEYIPAVLADWSGVQPVNVNAALDRIAAALGPIP